MLANKPSDYLNHFVRFGGMSLTNPGIIWKLRTVVITFCLVNLFISVGIAVFKSTADPIERAENFQFFASTSHVTPWHINILLRSKHFKGIVEQLDLVWTTWATENPMYERQFQNSNLIIRRVLMICSVSFYSLTPFKILECMFKNWGRDKEDWVVPMLMASPFPKSWFWITSIWQLVGMFCTSMSAVTSTVIMFSISKYIVLEIEILRHILRTRTPETANSKLPYLQHQRILRLVRDVNDFSSGQSFLQMLVNSVEVAVRVQCLFLVLRTDQKNILSAVLVLGLTMIMPLIVCYSGNMLIIQSDLLFQDIYQNRWYEESINSRKELIILSSMATKPMEFHYRFLFTFGMEQFANFCRAVYSYVMFLIQFF